MAIFGEQSAMMAALESRAAVRRGIISGTAITPAARQPKESDDEIQSRREQENRSVASDFVLLKARREGAGAPMQLARK